jgi:hypothetical protein
MLNCRHLVVFAIVIAVLACVGSAGEGRARPASTATATSGATPAKAGATIVYYFHGTSRCHTCRTIEAYADEAIKAAFAQELGSGAMQWKPTNVDEAANEHFIKDYGLYTRSLVVVDGANPTRFKNLERVWELVRDKPSFAKYVQDEVRAFRKS